MNLQEKFFARNFWRLDDFLIEISRRSIHLRMRCKPYTANFLSGKVIRGSLICWSVSLSYEASKSALYLNHNSFINNLLELDVQVIERTTEQRVS